MTGPDPLPSLQGLPRAAEPHVRRLLARPLERPERLGELVAAHVREVRQAASRREFLDLALVERLETSCEGLLQQLQTEADEGRRRLAQAAVLYFALSEDADDDLESIVGFDDDAAVVSAVARHLGRPDLVVEVA